MDEQDARVEPVARKLHESYGDYRRTWLELSDKIRELRREQARELIALADAWDAR